jgi:serine/threonine kinase 3
VIERLAFCFSELKKLSEESLTRQPEEVFDILCKLGEGSYGSVFKAVHKESGQVLAIKQVPVDTDLQEIIKEISIMQQCDSPYVVKYYGSYFKNTDLWVSIFFFFIILHHPMMSRPLEKPLHFS